MSFSIACFPFLLKKKKKKKNLSKASLKGRLHCSLYLRSCHYSAISLEKKRSHIPFHHSCKLGQQLQGYYLCQPSPNRSSNKILFQPLPYHLWIFQRTTIKKKNFRKSKLGLLSMRCWTGREMVERKIFQKHATAVPQQEGCLHRERM